MFYRNNQKPVPNKKQQGIHFLVLHENQQSTANWDWKHNSLFSQDIRRTASQWVCHVVCNWTRHLRNEHIYFKEHLTPIWPLVSPIDSRDLKQGAFLPVSPPPSENSGHFLYHCEVTRNFHTVSCTKFVDLGISKSTKIFCVEVDTWIDDARRRGQCFNSAVSTARDPKRDNETSWQVKVLRRK